MTAQDAQLQAHDSGPADDAGHLAQLCAIISLVEQMADSNSSSAPLADEAAIAQAYRRAPAVARRRFDQLAREAAGIATVGVEALIAAEGSPRAAARLAATLRRSVTRLAQLVA